MSNQQDNLNDDERTPKDPIFVAKAFEVVDDGHIDIFGGWGTCAASTCLPGAVIGAIGIGAIGATLVAELLKDVKNNDSNTKDNENGGNKNK
ncbi:MAG: hypothetical protein LBM93_04585 [Oscillospiraceae bacterium]|jgi:hypothetical protein|nr:hypothetical protein [Oscillospiraceae bacterium]